MISVRGALKASSILLACFVLHAIDAQRLKQGCYDAGPITCNTTYSDAEIDFDLEQVCQRIVLELLEPNLFFILDTNHHADYLNSVEASDEFCSQIRRAYSRCLFCDVDAFIELEEHIRSPQCGGQPSLDDILQNDQEYSFVATKADINATCQKLQESKFILPGERPYPVPGTIELANKMMLIQHLCPGVCDGTCFDSETYPPSCEPVEQYNGTFDDEAWVCTGIISFAFPHADVDTILDISKHVDYLGLLQENTTDCDMVRQAYPSCVFCADNLCFDGANQPSCDPPENAEHLHISYEETEDLCRQMYFSMHSSIHLDGIWNISSHATGLLIGDNNPQCPTLRSVYHQCYWCAKDPHDSFCLLGTLCEGNVTIPDNFNNTLIPSLNLTEDDLDCNLAYQLWKAGDYDLFSLQGCYEHIDLHQRCPVEFCELKGAPPIDTNYLGTTNTAQRRAIIWMSRASAILSFFGASYILYDILTDPKVSKNVYHQLLTGMACFDIITAIAWCFATAPVDSANDQGYYVEGAIGTEATCKAQAFFIQLGFTSIFYNVSLGVYYALVVAYGWKEFQLKKISLYMHLFPLLLGFGLALGAITSYHWFEYGCHILPTSDGPLWQVLVFVVLPLGLSIAAITISMFLVYWTVRSQAAQSRKWSLGVGKASKLEQAVFWQCFYYVLAFYISWPILFSVYLFSIDKNGPFGLALTVAFVAPLQGFNNFLVYIRPKTKQRGGASRRQTLRTSIATVFRLFDTGRSSIMQPSDGTGETRHQHTLADPSVAIATTHDDMFRAEPAPVNEEPSNGMLEDTVRCTNGLRGYKL